MNIREVELHFTPFRAFWLEKKCKLMNFSPRKCRNPYLVQSIIGLIFRNQEFSINERTTSMAYHNFLQELVYRTH